MSYSTIFLETYCLHYSFASKTPCHINYLHNLTLDQSFLAIHLVIVIVISWILMVQHYHLTPINIDPLQSHRYSWPFLPWTRTYRESFLTMVLSTSPAQFWYILWMVFFLFGVHMEPNFLYYSSLPSQSSIYYLGSRRVWSQRKQLIEYRNDFLNS